MSRQGADRFPAAAEEEGDAEDSGDPYFRTLEALEEYHSRLFAPGSSLSHAG